MIIEGDVPYPDAQIHVARVVDERIVFGDRNLSIVLPEGFMYISSDFLEEIDSEPKEFAHDNPYGGFVYTNEYQNSGQTLFVKVTRYERLTAVDVHRVDAYVGEHRASTTIYAQNFDDGDAAEAIVRAHIKDIDPELMVFELQALRAKETGR